MDNDRTILLQEIAGLRDQLQRKDRQLSELLAIFDTTTRDQASALDKLRETVLHVFRRNVELEKKIYSKPFASACTTCKIREV